MRAWIVGAVVVVVAGAALGAYLILRPEDYLAVHPPITPTATGTADPSVTIPPGFLQLEPALDDALDQPEVRWERSDEPSLPPLLDPCGTRAAEDGRVAGRQLALVTPTLYKVERMVVYRDEATAARAMSGHRDALSRCTGRPAGDGTMTVWRWEPLDIGEEAMFVAGQRYAGAEGTHGHHRGVLMRQGRTVMMYVDLGQATTIADRSEVAHYEEHARAMAGKIAAAPWS